LQTDPDRPKGSTHAECIHAADRADARSSPSYVAVGTPR
jgi:hypothetical protein